MQPPYVCVTAVRKPPPHIASIRFSNGGRKVAAPYSLHTFAGLWGGGFLAAGYNYNPLALIFCAE